MLIFEKAFEIRLVAEKQIKDKRVIVPSLNFPFRRRGRKNLRKIINKTKYAIACAPTNFAIFISSENKRLPINPIGKEIKNAIENKSDIRANGNRFPLRLFKNMRYTPMPTTAPKRDRPGEYGKRAKTKGLEKIFPVWKNP